MYQHGSATSLHYSMRKDRLYLWRLRLDFPCTSQRTVNLSHLGGVCLSLIRLISGGDVNSVGALLILMAYYVEEVLG